MEDCASEGDHLFCGIRLRRSCGGAAEARITALLFPSPHRALGSATSQALEISTPAYHIATKVMAQ